MEEDEDFCYIALELALGTVEEFVEGKYTCPEIDNISILRQASDGLEWLHKREISKTPLCIRARRIILFTFFKFCIPDSFVTSILYYFSIRVVSAMQNRTCNLTCFCDLGVDVSIHLTCVTGS